MNRKILILLTASLAAMTILLAGCGNKADEDVPEPTGTIDVNIPQNTVAPLIEPEASTSPDVTSDEAEPTDAPETEAPDETDPDAPETTPPAVTDDDDEDEVEDIVEELDTRAMACLKLFNSSKVHAKFVAAESYDGSEIFTTSVEYYINGSERVYITDGMKTMIRDGVVTFVDSDLGIYFTYPDEGGYDLDFGFARSKYKLKSQTTDEEVYEIDGTDITSTWTFRSDGSIRVADRASDGSFTLYDVETLESDVSMIDFTVPSSYEEVSADDYEFYR